MNKIRPFEKLLKNVITNACRPSPTRLSNEPSCKEKKVDLTASYLMDLFFKEQKRKCHWLEIELNPQWIFESNHPLALSVDRLDKDYLKGEVVICCRFANLGRNVCPNDKFKDILRYMKSQWGWDNYLYNPPIQEELF